MDEQEAGERIREYLRREGNFPECDSIWKRAESLGKRAFGALEELGFQYAKKPQTPGYVDAVVLEDIEIGTCATDEGIRIDVSIPAQRKPFEGFCQVRCARRDFLQNETMILATPETLEASILEAYKLAQTAIKNQ